MEITEKLKEIKELFDSGVINQEEFSSLKSKILTENLPIQNNNEQVRISENENNIEPIKLEGFANGSIRLIYHGVWILFDIETLIYLDDKLISKQSTKNGFDIIIPLRNDQYEVNLKLKILFRLTTIKINVNPLVENIILLDYSRLNGAFSSKFKIIK